MIQTQFYRTRTSLATAIWVKDRFGKRLQAGDIGLIAWVPSSDTGSSSRYGSNSVPPSCMMASSSTMNTFPATGVAQAVQVHEGVSVVAPAPGPTRLALGSGCLTLSLTSSGLRPHAGCQGQVCRKRAFLAIRPSDNRFDAIGTRRICPRVTEGSSCESFGDGAWVDTSPLEA